MSNPTRWVGTDLHLRRSQIAIDDHGELSLSRRIIDDRETLRELLGDANSQCPACTLVRAAVTTDGELRRDVDPVQLRWAGLPRARTFDPMDVHRSRHVRRWAWTTDPRERGERVAWSTLEVMR